MNINCIRPHCKIDANEFAQSVGRIIKLIFEKPDTARKLTTRHGQWLDNNVDVYGTQQCMGWCDAVEKLTEPILSIKFIKAY